MNKNDLSKKLEYALTLQKSKKYKKAIKIYKEVLKYMPKFIELYIAIAESYENIKNYKKAIKFYKLALKLDNLQFLPRIKLANIFSELNQFKKSEKEFIFLLKNYKDEKILNDYASMLKDNQKYKKAIKYYKKAIKHNPKFLSSHYNLSIVYFMIQKYKKAFKKYEYRLDEEKFINHFKGFKNRYNNENINNKTLLIISEQGYGDNIEFIRFIKILKSKYPKSKIVLYTYKPLKRLFATLKEINTVITSDDNMIQYDYYIPIMSLGNILNIKAKNIIATNGYFKITNKKYNYIKQDKKFKIGIVFSGSKENNSDKEFKLKEFEPILKLNKNISFYSFQVGDEVKQLKKYKFIKDLGSNFIDFYDTASALKYMDLIISIDTAIVHLAGAINKKCYVIVSLKTGYFWGNKSSQTHWYNSVKVFFKSPKHSNKKVIQTIKNRLIKLLDMKYV